MQFPTLQYIRSLAITPRKRHSQHFLIDKNIAEKTISAAACSPLDTVIEIGPGLGALTFFLHVQSLNAYCFEIDEHLATVLSTSLPDTSSVHIINKDIMTVSFSEIAHNQGPIVLLGSIPYALTTPILFKVLEAAPYISRAVFIVQKEVAERLCARPGSKQYGILSVYCSAYAPAEILFTIPPSCFYPVPDVASAVIRLLPHSDKHWDSAQEVFFRQIVQGAFSRRRKTLLNALKSTHTVHGCNLPMIRQAGVRSGIDMQRRAETLSVDEWYRLSSALYELHCMHQVQGD
ncbi:MAG: 16S rRNA (adenine(1518)-N(6)/adenine(1519)-N(6))-dimethyltransferase RsmA [Desulfobacterota bacterium]|nr:16S rRNA (adenine(1518)-N(6)/adenine(1519)-N(6))-dimethyltransferase RsmA [Thermodesulfobacteriota bacterium]